MPTKVALTDRIALRVRPARMQCTSQIAQPFRTPEALATCVAIASHQRRRQTVIGLKPEFLQSSADHTLIGRVRAGLDDRGDERGEPRLRPTRFRR
jgi:hypothetical protein